VPLRVVPLVDKRYEGKYLDASVLAHVLPHPNEWNDDFTATHQPSLHFVLYIPNPLESPLYIREACMTHTTTTTTTTTTIIMI
jgi:hypothetical protein